jgi:hypothetical protein
MMKRSFLFALVVLSLSMASCAKVYYSPDAKKRANSHKVIAIAPPKVAIAASKKVDAEAIKEQQRTESDNFQKEMYSWMLRRKMQNKIFVDIQDVETTNVMLKRAGHSPDNPLTPTEMCEVLGVDGLLTSNYSLTKPMSEGAAIAVGLVAGFWGTTNNTSITLEIHDKKTEKLIWNYNHEASGGVGSTPTRLVDNLMRQASRRMPYKN